MTESDDPIVIARLAENTANHAIQLVAESANRIERAIEAMRTENTTQHMEGRRYQQTMARGLHRRMDKQDEDRVKLRDHVDTAIASVSTEAKGAVEAVSAENAEGRRRLHSKIDTLIWAILGFVASGAVSLIALAWWLFTHPAPVRFPIG